MLASLRLRRSTLSFNLTKLPLPSNSPLHYSPNSTQSHTTTLSTPTEKHHILSLLQKCTSLDHLNQLHALLFTLGHSKDPFATAKLLSFCVNLGSRHLKHAILLFSQAENRTTFMWNTIIKAYSQYLFPNGAVLFYIHMLREGALPNKFTFPSLIKSCLQLREGAQIHCQVLKYEFGNSDLFLHGSLLNMYANCGDLDSTRQVFDEISQFNPVCWTSMIYGYLKFGCLNAARQLFNEMPERDSVCWSAMISGYIQKGYFKEGLSLFSDMQLSQVKPNQAVLVSVLSACANLGALEQGKWIHAYMSMNRIRWNIELCTAMINMYANCGEIDIALHVFKSAAPQAQALRDVGTWNAVLSGLAINGRGKESFDLFFEMQRLGVRPDDVTFIAVMNACNHSALVNEGRYCFESMSRVYGIAPKIQHYGCFVDLLGRAGLLDDAEVVIRNMAIKPDARIWGSLLNACMIHGDIELGERVGENLVRTQPQDNGYYVLLANLYASFGRWDDVSKVRNLLQNQCADIARIPGCSLIEVNERQEGIDNNT